MRSRLLLLSLLSALAVAATTGAQVSHAATTTPPSTAVTGLPLLGTALGMVPTVVSAAGGQLAHATAATTWRDTASKGLVLKGTALGPVDAATPLHVAVAMSLRNATQLQQSIAAGAAELSPDEFAATYGPTQADLQAVAGYLSQNGFTNVAVEPNGLFVTADGTAAAAEAAFNTSIVGYSVDGATLYANSTAAQVPAQLNGVLSVIGLNDAATMSLPLRKADVGVPSYITDYTPQGFWKAYDATTAPTGSKTPIAIFAEGDVSGVVTDLRTLESKDGLSHVPVSVVQVGLASPDTAGADEWDMDTQYSTGMAGTVSRLYLYDTTSLTDSDITLEFNRFVTDDKAKAGSASFGECEYQAYLDGSMVAMDQVFAEAAAQGQTVFASAGDTGGFCPVAPDNGVPAGAPDVNYPASSPYVVSAGGTSLLTNADGTYDNELAWVAGGGGPSIFESQPFWQQGVAPPTGSTCVEYAACVGKTLPDVAMDADPNSGAEVYVDGAPEAIGGTSLSSPLTLGVWARLQSAHSNKLGFAAPKLYAAAGSTGFHDVTLGNTGPYPAAPGYDLATGLGTFDVASMVTAIAK